MGYFENDDGDAFKPLLELRSEGYWTSRRGGATYRKAVLCSLPEAGRPPVSSTTGTSSADIVGAMNDWLREALAVDANGTKKDPPVLAPHWWKPFFDARNAFSRAVSLGRYPPPLAESNYSSWRAAASQPPPATSRPLPVFYPFSGADLLSAMAMLPAAPSYTLTSGLPVGTPDCFLSAACRAVATRHGRLYFQSLLTHSTGWTETQRMQAWMDTVQRAESKVGEPSSSGGHDASTPTAAPMVATGVLPVLLLSLHLAGHSVVHAERTTAHAVSLVCEGGTRVTYVPRALGPSLWPYFAAGDGKEDGRPSRTNGALRGMPALARPSPSTASLTLASPCAAALQARQSSTKSWHDNLKLVECLEQHEPGSLGDSLELQLDWLDRYVLDAQPAVAADTKEAAAARYAILIKAAGNARDLINSPLMSSWLLQHSMAWCTMRRGLCPPFTVVKATTRRVMSTPVDTSTAVACPRPGSCARLATTHGFEAARTTTCTSTWLAQDGAEGPTPRKSRASSCVPLPASRCHSSLVMADGRPRKAGASSRRGACRVALQRTRAHTSHDEATQ